MDERTPVKVSFRKYDGFILALMPEEPSDLGGRECLSYAHVGQHSAADPYLVVAESRPATPEEYAPLKAELEGRGYVVEVIERVGRQHHEVRALRAAELRRPSR